VRTFITAVLAILLTACATAPDEDPGAKAGGDVVHVCHKGKKTLELPPEAIAAHLDHGDRLGPC
jgi:hypothetical protein